MSDSLWRIIKLYFEWRRYLKAVWADGQTALGFALWLEGRKTTEALGHIENLLDCINDARVSTIPPIQDNEQLTTISWGYSSKVNAAREFIRREKWNDGSVAK